MGNYMLLCTSIHHLQLYFGQLCILYITLHHLQHNQQNPEKKNILKIQTQPNTEIKLGFGYKQMDCKADKFKVFVRYEQALIPVLLPTNINFAKLVKYVSKKF